MRTILAVLLAAGMLGCAAPVVLDDTYRQSGLERWQLSAVQGWNVLLDCPQGDGFVHLTTGEIGGDVEYRTVRLFIVRNDTLFLNIGPDVPSVMLPAKEYRLTALRCGGK